MAHFARNVLILFFSIVTFSSYSLSQESEYDFANIRTEDAKRLIEPDYDDNARYCLLIIGETEMRRVWLVLDGNDTLYVDRNGNRNLTEPDEKLSVAHKIETPEAPKTIAFHYFRIPEVGGVEMTLTVAVPNSNYEPTSEAEKKDARESKVHGWKPGRLTRALNGNGPMFTSDLVFCKIPANAQVAWIGGPLEIISGAEAVGRKPKATPKRAAVSVLIGARGLPTTGASSPSLYSLHVSAVPEDIYPVATFHTEEGPISLSLDQTANHTFSGLMEFPKNEKRASIGVELSFPEWKKVNIEPLKLTIPIK